MDLTPEDDAIDLSTGDFNELLSRASRLYRFIGRAQLQSLSRIFEVSPEDMHLMYLHKLSTGLKLPPMLVAPELLEKNLS